MRTFTDWFMTWPVIVLGILVVCLARIAVEVADKRARDRDEDR